MFATNTNGLGDSVNMWMKSTIQAYLGLIAEIQIIWRYRKLYLTLSCLIASSITHNLRTFVMYIEGISSRVVSCRCVTGSYKLPSLPLYAFCSLWSSPVAILSINEMRIIISFLNYFLSILKALNAPIVLVWCTIRRESFSGLIDCSQYIVWILRAGGTIINICTVYQANKM